MKKEDRLRLITQMSGMSELYEKYSLPVRLYHAWHARLEVIENDRDYKEACRYAQMARTVILYRMSDEEYEELQASMRGHIAQARIQLKKDREFLKTVLVRYFSMN